MIPERNMKQAKRIDNGELVVGFLVHDDIMRIRKSGFGVQTINISTDCKFDGNGIRVDPATVEDVAVKPNDLDKLGKSFGKPVYCGSCPNCEHTVASSKNYPYELNANDYCGHCGQRLDWSE